MWEDRVVSCIQGTQLKAGEVRKASLKDLKSYYRLSPRRLYIAGTYGIEGLSRNLFP